MINAMGVWQTIEFKKVCIRCGKNFKTVCRPAKRCKPCRALAAAELQKQINADRKKRKCV